MPLPWTMRTRGMPARKARSTNFSTSRVASSTVRPMTLISVGVLRSSFSSETENPRARAALTGEADQHLGDILAGHAHLHRAHLDFKSVALETPLDDGIPA